MYGYGLAMGALCGILVGIYLEQVTWGLVIGAAVGLAIGLIYDKKKENKS